MRNIRKYSIILTLILLMNIFCIFTIENPKAKFCSVNENLNSEKIFDGYTLFTPEWSKYTYLIDNNGKTVHSWKSNHIQGLAVYLLENGNLLRSDSAGIKNIDPDFIGTGVTGRVEMFDWNGSLIWDFIYSSDKHCLHHDIEPLPNGNVLMIAYQSKTYEECVSAGCNPDLVERNGMWIDHIIEVEPIFPSGGNIVWEWHAWDHIIQDYDLTKPNYGIVEDHSELIDINYRSVKRHASPGITEFLHMNSVDYNEEFDQLLLTSRNINEIWVIDHSTTTEEAAGHIGGNSGKGGDILYRWGNPQVYRAGDEDDQQLYMPHDARWIENDVPGEGHITVFNNGVGRLNSEFSSVDEIIPTINSYGDYYLEQNSSFGPDEPVWSYSSRFTKIFYSPYVSGAQRLPNGNTLICSGWRKGLFLEVNNEKEVVNRYINRFPFYAFKTVFKTQSYPLDYPGLGEFNHNRINRPLLILLQNIFY